MLVLSESPSRSWSRCSDRRAVYTAAPPRAKDRPVPADRRARVPARSAARRLHPGVRGLRRLPAAPASLVADWSTDENLESSAFTPGGVLLRDAPDIHSEDLDWRGGYERVLSAMAGGARRRSRIAEPSAAAHRLHPRPAPARRLRTDGSPIGPGGSADPYYEIADDYLAYWFAVLRDDADLIDGGQGGAVQRRTAGTLADPRRPDLRGGGPRAHQAARPRWHACPDADRRPLVAGRDRRDRRPRPRRRQPVLVGECRWQAKAIDERDLAALRAKVSHLSTPAPGPELTFAFWSRGGATESLARHPDVRVFTPAQMLGED